MDELTYAITMQFNPKPGLTPDMQANAKAYCMKIIQDHRKDPSYFFALLQTSPDLYVKFWSIGALEEIVTNYYQEYDISLRHQLHEYYFQTLEKQPGTVLCSPYIEAKYANFFCLILRQDYPDYWPEAFTRLLSLLQLEASMTNPAAKIKYIGFILTALVAFDREIVDFYELKKSEEHQKSVKIKDEMRKSVVNDIAFLLQQVIENYVFFRDNSAENVVVQALEVLEKTVDWAKVELFVGNLPTIIQFLGVGGLQTQAAKCLYAIIDKGMDASLKVSLFDSLNLIYVLSQWDPRIPGHDEDFQKIMATIVNKIGLIFLEYSSDPKVPYPVKENVGGKLPTVIEMAYKYLDQDYPSVAVIIAEFLNQYLVLLKKIELQPFHAQSVQTLFEIVMKRIQLPAEYFKTAEPPQVEEAFEQVRNELTTLFVNMVSIPAMQQNLIEYIGQMVQMLKTPAYKEWGGPQKEVVLYLFYRLGQSLKDATGMLKTEGSALAKMVEAVLGVPDIFTDHLLILGTALEGLVRYAAYFEFHDDACTNFLAFFLSEKGVRSSDMSRASKVAEELFKFLEKLKYKPCLTKHYSNILTNLNSVIKSALEGKLRLTQDGLQSLYQSVGLILAYKSTGMDTRLTLLREHYNLQLSLLKSTGTTPKVSTQFVKNIALLLRSFEGEVEGELKELIREIAQTTLDILRRYLGDVTIREAILQLFHKLVIMMGVAITPLVKEFLGLILQQQSCDFGVLSAVVKLANLVAHTWKANGLGFIREVFGFLLQSMTSLGFPPNKVSDIEKSHVELIQNYLKFLKALLTLDVGILYEQSVDQHTALFQYINKCSEYVLDEYIKRQGVVLVGMAVAGSMGLALTSESLNSIATGQPGKTAKMPALLPEYAIHTGIMMEHAENVALGVIERVNINSQYDLQTLVEVAALHFLLFKINQASFVTKFEAWCNVNVAGITFPMIKEQLVGLQEKGMVKEYKEVLRQVITAGKVKAA